MSQSSIYQQSSRNGVPPPFNPPPCRRNAFVVVVNAAGRRRAQTGGENPELEQLVRLVRAHVCCVGKCAHKAAHKVPRKSFAGTAKSPTGASKRQREREMEEWILMHSVPHSAHYVMFVSMGNVCGCLAIIEHSPNQPTWQQRQHHSNPFELTCMYQYKMWEPRVTRPCKTRY